MRKFKPLGGGNGAAQVHRDSRRCGSVARCICVGYGCITCDRAIAAADRLVSADVLDRRWRAGIPVGRRGIQGHICGNHAWVPEKGRPRRIIRAAFGSLLRHQRLFRGRALQVTVLGGHSVLAAISAWPLISLAASLGCVCSQNCRAMQSALIFNVSHQAGSFPV